MASLDLLFVLLLRVHLQVGGKAKGKTSKENKHFLLPAFLQKLVGDFFFIFSQGNLGNLVGNLVGNLAGNFVGFFLSHRIKAQKFRGKFRSIFREKIRSSNKNLSCKIHSADVPP